LENAKYITKLWGWSESIVGAALIRMIYVGFAAAAVYLYDKKRTGEVVLLKKQFCLQQKQIDLRQKQIDLQQQQIDLRQQRIDLQQKRIQKLQGVVETTIATVGESVEDGLARYP